jgi:hypothetical protein
MQALYEWKINAGLKVSRLCKFNDWSRWTPLPKLPPYFLPCQYRLQGSPTDRQRFI